MEGTTPCPNLAETLLVYPFRYPLLFFLEFTNVSVAIDVTLCCVSVK